MPEPWLVVVGGSAGAIEPLSELLAELPSTLPAAVVVVLHMHPRSETMVPQILARRSGWPVVQATDGEAILPGRAYTAAPDHHLLVDDTRLRVVRGPKESGHRPGVDPLFRSAAASPFDTIGVVLSGGLDDGSAGAARIARSGGVVAVQDPMLATVPDMPDSARLAVPEAAVLSIDGIASLITTTILERDPDLEVASTSAVRSGPAPFDLPTIRFGDTFVCPDCGGAMAPVDDPDTLRYRCHVGHGWTAEALRLSQDDRVDGALWTALRTMEDQIALDERLLERATVKDRPRGADVIRERLAQRREASRALWRMLTSGPEVPDRVRRPTGRGDGDSNADSNGDDDGDGDGISVVAGERHPF